MATKAAGSSEAMRQKTAERAYLIWESMGRPHGYDRQHWIQAEAELSGQGAKAGDPKSTAMIAKAPKSTVTAATATAAMSAGAAPAKATKKPGAAKRK